MIAVDQSLETDLIIALEPIAERSSVLPALTARQVVIVARSQLTLQELSRCSGIALAMFGKEPLWIGKDFSGAQTEKNWQAWWRRWLASACPAMT